MRWLYLDKTYKDPSFKAYPLAIIIYMFINGVLLALMTPGVDAFAHLGGFIFGFFLYPVLMDHQSNEITHLCGRRIWFWLGVIIHSICIPLFLILLFTANIPSFTNYRQSFIWIH